MSHKTVYRCDRCKQEIHGDARYLLDLQFKEQPGAVESTRRGDRSMDLCGWCAGILREVLSWTGTVTIDPDGGWPAGGTMSPVTFIKRECPRHRGCFTMTDKCDRCIEEEFAARVTEATERWAKAVAEILGRVEQ